MTCPSGQFCIHQDDVCKLVEAPCQDPSSGDSTSEPAAVQCWDLEDTYQCEPIPEECLGQPEILKDCIEEYARQPLCYLPDRFEDLTLECLDYECAFVYVDNDNYYYCYNLCQ